MTAKCNHQTGDMISCVWVCATCYQALSERPAKYYMDRREPEIDENSGGRGTRGPFQRVKYADVAMASNGTPFEAYVQAMATRLEARTFGGMAGTTAVAYALFLLRKHGVSFGSSEFRWTLDSALTMVDVDMSYWDESGDGSNR